MLSVAIVIGNFSGIIPGTVTSVHAANQPITWVCSYSGNNWNYVYGTGQTYTDQNISVIGTGSDAYFSGSKNKFNIVIYANSYLTFNSTDGKISQIVITSDDMTLNYAENIPGWTAASTTLTWSGEPSESVKLSFTGIVLAVQDISSIVFTIEEPTVTSNVTLNTNGGTINSDDITTYDEGTGATLPTDVTKDGYTFDGWYDKSDFSGNKVTAISATDTGKKEYWAKWTPVEYTITYANLLDGTNPNTVTSYTIESETITFENPTRTGYTGSWDITSISSGSTGNRTITAVWEINKYKVTFIDYNGTELKTQENVEYNTSAIAPANPTRDGYTFTGWDKEFTKITADTTIKATYSVNSYTVTWTNYDDKVLKTDTVNYGETPKYTGATPTKPADAQYTYTFVGWTPTINTVTGNVTYKATYIDAKNKYTVKWLNYDNAVLQEETVDYGVTPKYTGDTPTKPADEQYTYTFLNWTPVVVPVVDNVVYIATYNNTVNKYTIKFVDEDGTEISSKEYDYGTSANDIVKPDEPTKDATAEYTYTFAGWDSEVTDVTADKTYKATYTSEVNKYTVTFKDYDGTTVLDSQQVDYGQAATAPSKPTRTGYTFKGWDKTFDNVTEDLEVTAQYEINKYTITFVDEDGTEISSKEYDYGTAATDIVKPSDPTKDKTAQYTYTFAGWDSDVTDVTADKTYKATYTSTVNKYTVTFDSNGGNDIE